MASDYNLPEAAVEFYTFNFGEDDGEGHLPRYMACEAASNILRMTYGGDAEGMRDDLNTLLSIDGNGDGAVDEQEFKAAAGDSDAT